MSATDINNAEFRGEEDGNYAVVDAEKDRQFRNWVLAGFGVVMAAGLCFFAYTAYQYYQLPAPFTAKPGDTLMTYITATNDPVERARIAIRAADRTDQPILATELCGQAVQRVPGVCGRPQEVSAKQAMKLVRFTDTVQLNVPLYPGDFMDARRGFFKEAPRPVTTVEDITVTAPPPK